MRWLVDGELPEQDVMCLRRSASTARVTGMSTAAPLPQPRPTPPATDPQVIRTCLPPTLAAEFDNEWEIVLDRVKQSRDLDDLQSWLNKWRHTAYMELRDPGSYDRITAKAEQILRTGAHPGAVPVEDLHALIAQRLGR